jgi:hypothetical protein
MMDEDDFKLTGNFDPQRISMQKKKLANYIILKSLQTDALLVKSGSQSNIELSVLQKITSEDTADIGIEITSQINQPDWLKQADETILGERRNAKQTKKALRNKLLPKSGRSKPRLLQGSRAEKESGVRQKARKQERSI